MSLLVYLRDIKTKAQKTEDYTAPLMPESTYGAESIGTITAH